MKVKPKPPRYDEVYFEGVKLLDEIARGDTMKNLIRWEQDEEFKSYWYGYVGKVEIFELCRYEDTVFITFLFDEYDYTTLKSAKRGAERMFKKFLKDAGLEVTP